MYDPVYRSVMGSSCKNLKPPSNKEEMDKKLYSSIKGLDVANNIKVKEVDSKTMVLRSNSPTSKKIPVMKENTYGKLSVKKQQPKKKKKEEEPMVEEKEEVDEAKDNEAVNEGDENKQWVINKWIIWIEFVLKKFYFILTYSFKKQYSLNAVNYVYTY